MRKRLRYSTPSLPQSLVVGPIVCCRPSLLSWKNRDGEQHEAPIIQEEIVSDLLQHLDVQKSMGPDGIHLREPRELVEVLTKPLSILYQQSWLAGEVPFDWRLENVKTICKKGWKEELVSCQSDLGASKGHGADRLEYHYTICGQPGDQAQSAWVYEGQVMLNKPDLLYDKVTCLVNEKKAVNVVYLNFGKAFDTTPQRPSGETVCMWLG